MAKWGEIKCPRCAELEAENAQLKQMWWDAGNVTDLAGIIADLQAERDALAVKLETAVKALQAAADDLSGYVGYSYANEYRTILAELKGGNDE